VCTTSNSGQDGYGRSTISKRPCQTDISTRQWSRRFARNAGQAFARPLPPMVFDGRSPRFLSWSALQACINCKKSRNTSRPSFSLFLPCGDKQARTLACRPPLGGAWGERPPHCRRGHAETSKRREIVRPQSRRRGAEPTPHLQMGRVARAIPPNRDPSRDAFMIGGPMKVVLRRRNPRVFPMGRPGGR